MSVFYEQINDDDDDDDDVIHSYVTVCKNNKINLGLLSNYQYISTQNIRTILRYLN